MIRHRLFIVAALLACSRQPAPAAAPTEYPDDEALLEEEVDAAQPEEADAAAVECAQRAAENECRPAFEACTAEPRCAAMEACLFDCHQTGYTDDCVDACYTQYEDAAETLEAASHCIHEVCGPE